jgi:predicted nucleotidyltransferase
MYYCVRLEDAMSRHYREIERLMRTGPVTTFTVSAPTRLVMELHAWLDKTDQRNRAAFVRRAIVAELDRDRRRRLVD